MLCKKPYDVCDYPNGDVYVRQALETLLRSYPTCTNPKIPETLKLLSPHLPTRTLNLDPHGVIRRTTDKQCQDSMKIFLCALYRRKCGMETDPNRASPTFRNRAVRMSCPDLDATRMRHG